MVVVVTMTIVAKTLLMHPCQQRRVFLLSEGAFRHLTVPSDTVFYEANRISIFVLQQYPFGGIWMALPNTTPFINKNPIALMAIGLSYAI